MADDDDWDDLPTIDEIGNTAVWVLRVYATQYSSFTANESLAAMEASHRKSIAVLVEHGLLSAELVDRVHHLWSPVHLTGDDLGLTQVTVSVREVTDRGRRMMEYLAMEDRLRRGRW